jgi:hypothetical protein
MIHRIVGEALERAEQLVRKKGMNKDAETFARASTHWLRHTFGLVASRQTLSRLSSNDPAGRAHRAGLRAPLGRLAFKVPGSAKSPR